MPTVNGNTDVATATTLTRVVVADRLDPEHNARIAVGVDPARFQQHLFGHLRRL